MPAKKSQPKTDNTEQPLFIPMHAATVAPDGAPPAAYNESVGRAPDAATSGSQWDRQVDRVKAKASRSKGEQGIPPAYGVRK